MDRIFLDANILFSAAYGSPGLIRLWELARRGKCRLLASDYVVEEARRNLDDSRQVKTLDGLLETVEIVPEVDPQTPCPLDLPEKDRPVLLAAISAKADYLVTGDMVHFGNYFRKTVGPLKICLPRQYFQSREAHK